MVNKEFFAEREQEKEAYTYDRGLNVTHSINGTSQIKLSSCKSIVSMDYQFRSKSSARPHAPSDHDLPRQISRCSNLRPMLRAGKTPESKALSLVDFGL
jgi:hypothetical protein